MKKMKFTFGLMLSLLFMGANVTSAQNGFNPTLQTKAEMKESFFVKANPNYTYVTSRYNISYGNINTGYYSPMFTLFSSDNILQKDTVFPSDPYFPYQDIYYFQSTYQSISLKQAFTIMFNYKEGKDLRPLVKAKITIGQWETQYDKSDVNKVNPFNGMSSTGIEINEYLVPTEVDFTPSFDRKTGVATYKYSMEIMELIAKYPVYSIDFEISLNDEIGVVGSDPDGPQLGSLPQNMRKVTVNAGEGVKANITTDGSNAFYVPSYKNYTFTVESDKDIEVTCDRNADEKYGIVKEEISKGVYSVTIKQIRSNCTINIEQVETKGGIGDDGQTGNDLFDDYAVWGANGTLYVKSATAVTLSIYNVSGQLCKQTTVNGSTSFQLIKGLYMVQLNGKTYKVVL